MTTIHTIGYEGTDIASFIAELKKAGVARLADVRALPLSRKKGFSKRALREALEAEGIEYVHFQELGDPKPGREAARAGRYEEFERIYEDHLDGPSAQLALKKLAESAKANATCMMCFERDPRHCHRLIIARELKNSGLRAANLFPPETRLNERQWIKLPRRSDREGAAAA